MIEGQFIPLHTAFHLGVFPYYFFRERINGSLQRIVQPFQLPSKFPSSLFPSKIQQDLIERTTGFCVATICADIFRTALPPLSPLQVFSIELSSYLGALHDLDL